MVLLPRWARGRCAGGSADARSRRWDIGAIPHSSVVGTQPRDVRPQVQATLELACSPDASHTVFDDGSKPRLNTAGLPLAGERGLRRRPSPRGPVRRL